MQCDRTELEVYQLVEFYREVKLNEFNVNQSWNRISFFNSSLMVGLIVHDVVAVFDENNTFCHCALSRKLVQPEIAWLNGECVF